MTYEEFKKTFSFNDIFLKKINNEFCVKARDELLALLLLFPQSEIIDNPYDVLTKLEREMKIQQLFNALQSKFDYDKNHRVKSYSDFKKLSMYDFENNFNDELYTEKEIADILNWSRLAFEEIKNAKLTSKYIKYQK